MEMTFLVILFLVDSEDSIFNPHQVVCPLHQSSLAVAVSLLKCLVAGLQIMFCSVSSLIEQRSSRNRWNSVLAKSQWNSVLTDTCSNYSLGCPVGPTSPSFQSQRHLAIHFSFCTYLGNFNTYLQQARSSIISLIMKF